jgi:hypothetical protein
VKLDRRAANTTITVSGQGLVQGAVVKWNGTALSTTWVSLNQVTAVIPASLLAATGTGHRYGSRSK